jgi:hypothetical protein
MPSDWVPTRRRVLDNLAVTTRGPPVYFSAHVVNELEYLTIAPAYLFLDGSVRVNGSTAIRTCRENDALLPQRRLHIGEGEASPFMGRLLQANLKHPCHGEVVQNFRW